VPATLAAASNPGDGDAVRRLWVRDTTLCPRCRTSSAVDFGARYLCGQCGNQWQSGPVEVRTSEQDDLGAASVPLSRLRTYLTRPRPMPSAPKPDDGQTRWPIGRAVDMSEHTEMVDAWQLNAGDELPGGVIVVSIHREATRRTVRILTDEPASADLPSDSPVAVVRRLL